MATKTDTSVSLEQLDLEAAALDIFARKATNMMGSRPTQAQKHARDAFQLAEAFMAMRSKHRSGELKVEPKTGPQLADCCCPNLPKTHPHNIVSSEHGSLELVRRIHDWMTAHPFQEGKSVGPVLESFNKAFPACSWDYPTYQLAAAILPHYV